MNIFSRSAAITAILIIGASFHSSALAKNPIPVGEYASPAEVCKLEDKDYDNLAQFRARFGSLALLHVEEGMMSFPAGAGSCDLGKSKSKSIGASKFETRIQCDTNSAPEDVVFSIEIKTDQVTLSVIKGPRDGFFSPGFRKDYVRCKEKQ